MKEKKEGSDMPVLDAGVSEAWAAFLHVDRDHAAVAALVRATERRVIERDAVLLREADDDDTVFLVARGRLRAVRHTSDGQEVWFTDIHAGEMIGEIAALTGGPRTSSVTANAQTVLYAVTRSAFLEMLRQHGEIGLAVARLLAQRLASTSTQVADLVAFKVQNRLHRELVRLSTPTADGKAIVRLSETPSVTQLGQRIHATREATSRALKDLEMRGLIARSDDAWILLARKDAAVWE